MKINSVLHEIQSICHSLDKASPLRSIDLDDHHGLRSAYGHLVLSALTVIHDLCDDIERALQLELEERTAASNIHAVEDPFDANPY